MERSVKEKAWVDIVKKVTRVTEDDWQDIIDRYDLDLHYDSLRKQVTGEFGSYKMLLEKEESKSAMGELKDIIGELDIKKGEIKSKTAQLNRLKRNFIKSIEIANDLKELMIEEDFIVNIPEYCYKPVVSKGNGKVLVHITDWHIGLRIDNCKYNSFDLDIAKDRIKQLYDEVVEIANLYKVNDIVVVSTGDMIEHCYMRNNQHQNVEFNQSVQINECIKLMYTFLTNLCKIGNVDFYGLSGNHDRTVGDRSVNVDGDNANTVITEQLYNYNEIAQNERLTIHRLRHDAKEVIVNLDGVIAKFIHGDDKIRDAKRLIENDFSMDDMAYDVLFRGHWHNFDMMSENNGRYIVSTGCLSGYNDYSTKFGCTTMASQTVGVFVDGKVKLIKDVLLN